MKALLILGEFHSPDIRGKSLLHPSCSYERNVEAFYHHAWPFSSCVSMVQLRVDGAPLTRHEREIVVVVDYGKDAVPALRPHYLQPRHQ